MFVTFHYGPNGDSIILNTANIASAMKVVFEDQSYSGTCITLNTPGGEYIMVNETVEQVSQILRMVYH